MDIITINEFIIYMPNSTLGGIGKKEGRKIHSHLLKLLCTIYYKGYKWMEDTIAAFIELRFS